MLRTAAALNAGEHAPMASWEQVKGELRLWMYLIKPSMRSVSSLPPSGKVPLTAE